MKLRMKSLAVAVALVATGVAHAAIDSPNTGNGEMFLTIWDPTVGNEASFNIGLNLNIDSSGGKTAFNGNGSYTFSNIFSDPVFTSNFNATNLSEMANWKWNITAGATIPSFDERAMFTENSAGVQLNNSAAQNAAAGVLTYQTALGSCDSCGTHVKASPTYAGDNYGKDFNGNAPVNNAGSIGQSLFFYLAENNFLNDFLPDGNAIMTQYAYQWSLDANGNLTYNAVGAPVPVPAAVWLLGSALAGLVGVARRRDSQALTA
jgi:hypothetical protein